MSGPSPRELLGATAAADAHARADPLLPGEQPTLRVPIASIDIYANPAKMKVTGGWVVWPSESKLEVGRTGNRLHVRVPNPGRYTALYLRLG